MELTSGQEEIAALKAEIAQIRFSDPNRVIELATRILEINRNLMDANDAGYALFAIGDAYYTLGDSDHCLSNINRAMVEFNSIGDWQSLGECYNLLGIMFSHQGNMANALESYYEGIDLAETYHLDFLGAMIYQNFAELCDRTDNDSEALRKAYQSKEYINRLSGHPRMKELKLANDVALIKSNLKIGNLEEAREIYEDFNDFLLAFPDYTNDLDVILTQILLAKAEGRDAEAISLLHGAYDSFLSYPYGIDFFWEGIELMAMMEENQMDDMLEVIMNHIRNGVQTNAFPDLLMRLSKYRIKLLRRKGMTKEMTQELLDYFSYNDMQTEQSNRNMYQFIELRDSLKQSNMNNELLRQRADTDELTALPNRRRLNEASDQFFDMAMSTQKNFGVEMLDIDKFKTVNDIHGHMVGDACLVALAEVLRTIQSDQVFAARYGGDEFFILYLGISRDEMYRTCSMINSRLRDIISQKGLPIFTISQGICERIPQGPNKLWDFTSLADMALYESKRRGGGEITIVQNSQELKQISLKDSEKR